MSEPTPTEAWVFHAGALGDSVLLWPLVRALGHRWDRVHFVADAEKARLAASSIVSPGEIVPHDAQGRAFTRLWSGDAERVERGAGAVYNFVADDPALPWAHGARRMFPRAEIMGVGPPGDPSRARAWASARAERWGAVPARWEPNGPVVLHVGAGSAAKRWAIERWRAVRDSLGRESVVVAGEVEAEKFTTAERDVFASMEGRWCASLAELGELLASARAYVGADTGPTHLAAQLGVPTLALFGPTDPAVWSPVGPCVRVLHPPAPSQMGWLDAGAVRAALGELLA